LLHRTCLSRWFPNFATYRRCDVLHDICVRKGEIERHCEHIIPAPVMISLMRNPIWNYEDIGLFFLPVVFVGPLLRLLVRFHSLSGSELNNPSVLLQFALISSLSLALYLVLKLRHHRPALRSLGWVWPRPVYVIVGLTCGSDSGLRRCALFVVLSSQHLANSHYGAASSGPFPGSDSRRVIRSRIFVTSTRSYHRQCCRRRPHCIPVCAISPAG